MNQCDQHTILIKHKDLDDTTLRKILKKELKKIGGINRNFALNNIKNYKGEFLGIAFAYISDSKGYYALIGKNLDGTDRVVYESDAQSFSTGGRWADIVELERILDPLIQIDDRIRIFPAFATIPEDKFQSNVLYSSGIQDNITSVDVWRAFSKFVPGAFNNKENSYPRVHINRDKKIVIVKFRENSSHAIFALHMCKLLTVKGCALKFKHAFAK